MRNESTCKNQSVQKNEIFWSKAFVSGKNRVWEFTKHTWIQLILDVTREKNNWQGDYLGNAKYKFFAKHTCIKTVFNETRSKSIFAKMKLQAKKFYSTLFTRVCENRVSSCRSRLSSILNSTVLDKFSNSKFSREQRL